MYNLWQSKLDKIDLGDAIRMCHGQKLYIYIYVYV